MHFLKFKNNNGISIYNILIPIAFIVTLIVTGLYFYNYDKNQDKFLLFNGIFVFINYFISLIYLMIWKTNFKKYNYDKGEILSLYLIYIIGGYIFFINILLFLAYLSIAIYDHIKYLINNEKINIDI